MTKTGDYKTILNSLLADTDYEVLTSPAYNKQELENFIRTHQPKKGDYPMSVYNGGLKIGFEIKFSTVD